MKRSFYFALAAVCWLLLSAATPIADCRCNDIALYGRVRVVRYKADFKVKVVAYDADLRVEKVDYAPNRCGKWQFVEHSEDFTVQFVDYGEDFTIQYVDYKAGVH